MANDKTYDRHVNIWINGKQVTNDAASIKKAMYNLNNELARTTIGTKEYNEKAAELRKVKGILKEHQDNIAATGTAWSKVKGVFNSAQGILMAGIGAIYAGYQSLKSVIFSTDALGDKFERTLGGWKGGFEALARAIATLNFKDLFKNIKSAIDEGRRYAESLDVIDEKMRALQMQEADTKNQILIQKNIQNTSKSLQERIDAGHKIIKLEEDLERIRTGIAVQGYENEATNIANITHLTNEEVEAFARRDDSMISNIETGKKYTEFLKLLKQEERSLSGSSALAIAWTPEEIENLKAGKIEFANVTDEIKRYAFAAANMPGDDKMQLFVDKYVAMREAMTSGLEESLRVRSKLAAAEGGLDKTSTVSVENVFQTELSAKYNPDEYMQKEEEARLASEKALNDEREKDNKETQDQIAKDIVDGAEAGLEAKKDQLAEERKAQEEANADLISLKQDFVTGIIGLEETLFARQLAKLDARYKNELKAAGDNEAAKIKIQEVYDKKRAKLLRKAAIAEKAVAMFTIAINTIKGVSDAASKVVTTPLIPWIIAQGVIEAAIVAAKPLPEFYAGGYSAKAGKYTPVGVVHGGEWIAPSEMVASPTYGPVIQALEEERVKSLPGFVNGGPSTSLATSGPGSGQAAALTGSSPRLEAIMDRLTGILDRLERYGVKNIWPWKEINNMRKGMDKLEEIEGEVTL